MEDYYTIQSLRNRINDLDFLKLQRVVYPIIINDGKSESLISELYMEEYYKRLMNFGIDTQNFDMDSWLWHSMNDKFEEFIQIVNGGEELSNLSYKEISQTLKRMNSSIYHGYSVYDSNKVKVDYLGCQLHTNYFTCNTKEKNMVPYLHHEYDSKIERIISKLKDKADVKRLSEILSKYYIDFEELNYDQIEVLRTILIIKHDFGIYFSNLIYKLSHFLEKCDEREIPANLDNLNLQYISYEKLQALHRTLDLALKVLDEGKLKLMYESEIDIDLTELYEADLVNLMNDENVVLNAYNCVNEEIKKRRNSNFSTDALCVADLIKKDGKSKKKIKM